MGLISNHEQPIPGEAEAVFDTQSLALQFSGQILETKDFRLPPGWYLRIESRTRSRRVTPHSLTHLPSTSAVLNSITLASFDD
jgi:hypothetical protein